MSAMITPELARRLEQALARAGVDFEPANGQAIAQALRDAGIALVDVERQRALIDETVYAGALFRSQRWRALAEARHCPRCDGPADVVPRPLP
jgi:hypothetical protein